jgi:catalase
MDQASNTLANIHPLQAIQSTIGAAGGDPRPLQRALLFNNANDGPVKIIAKVSGVQGGGIREDDGPYFTNNWVFLSLTLRYSKTVGELPLASDTFLFQK